MLVLPRGYQLPTIIIYSFLLSILAGHFTVYATGPTYFHPEENIMLIAEDFQPAEPTCSTEENDYVSLGHLSELFRNGSEEQIFADIDAYWLRAARQIHSSCGKVRLPLMVAAIINTNEEQKAIRLVEGLFKRGASINMMDHQGRAALHAAIEKGWLVLMQFLINHGADPNAALENGSGTPLFCAVRGFSSQHLEAIHILIKAGAYVLKKCDGQTALDLCTIRLSRAFIRPAVREILLQKQALLQQASETAAEQLDLSGLSLQDDEKLQNKRLLSLDSSVNCCEGKHRAVTSS